ncbi:kinesin-like protein KIN-8A isoform X2 [Telopea speciosissima]|uniref:kinesin-like protein KIN-8A isoform X2 n=1 Tax=Telopea speciosissima TaxID=54955 RepID=UPI001CC49BF7|nr:kinesin-like protein KIN-8A isoform X2 [Telopea speciosissima]
MPVSTRSQVFSTEDDSTATTQRVRSRTLQEDPQLAPSPLRNPHHRLKEKMKALTLLYEQQKAAAASQKTHSARTEDKRFLTQASVELSGSGKGEDDKEQKEKKPCSAMRENILLPNSIVTRTFVLPPPNVSNISEDSKENMVMGGTDRIVGFTCPRKETDSTTKVVRKLSMGALGPQSEPRDLGGTKTVPELETISEKSGVGSRILVFVRLRPMAKKEKEAGSRCCVRIVNQRDIYLTEFASEMDYLRLKRLRGRHFTFDASFPDSTTQQGVYSTTTAELVEAVLQGRNGSVFCYGATGAGKTYTMLGTVENPGVMVLAIKDLFAKIRQRSCDGNHVVQLSYLEVYNETVRDLLSPGRPLVLREDKQGIVAAGLTQYRAYSTDEVMALLQRGNQNRTTEPTRVNETSSRSHAILQVMVEYRVKDAAMNVVNRVGKLSLIDLAGSERALATDQRTLRSLEGANINRSLLALSSCINALVEGKKHIPYRNSKLTQLLKDSLGGSCNTVMIANISPSNLSFGETQNTLHWADRAKEIRTKACQANEEPLQVPESETDQAKLILQLQKENRELRVLLARQQQKLLAAQAQSLAVNSSPTPSSVTSLLSPPPSSGQPNEKRRPRSSILAGNCFNTPVSKKKGADEPVRELRKTVKALESELERIKKEHLLQLKQKDNFIHELSRKCIHSPHGTGVAGTRRVVTRASLKPKESNEGELKSPNHRFLSPAPAAKKRSFWDITTANSPSVTKLNSRKTRSHIASGPPPAAPSMLLQDLLANCPNLQSDKRWRRGR